MREHGRELFAWLESGAHVYVCGDAQFMAPDVDSALREVIAQHGAFSTEQTDEYMLQLQRDRRYQKDVY
jgi:sulfite reductase (NADPH) flavoprotein alpha-component